MSVSIVSAVVTGVFSLILGFIWYGPLFAKPWGKLVGLTEKDLSQGAGIGYLFSFVSSTFLGAIISYLVITVGIATIVNAVLFGLALGIGLVATTFATNYIFSKRPLQLYLIDAGYQVLLVLAAVIIAFIIK